MTDPRSRDTSTNTETFDGDNSTTEFSLTLPGSGNHLSAITSVSIDGTDQSKWLDYWVDLQNKTITFYTAPASGTDNISVTYKYGQNWIYPDRPSSDDNNKVMTDETEWPRVSVIVSGGGGDPLGKQDTDAEDSLLVTVEVRTKEKYRPTINGVIYDSQRLAHYFARRAKKYLRSEASDMDPELYDVRPSRQPRNEPFDENYQTSYATYEFTVKGINTGEA